MPDDPRVQLLIDELLDSDATPEEVCGSCVELLPVVRDRWRQVCQARDQLDILFPPAAEPGATLPAPAPGDISLPSIPGYVMEAVLGVGGMGVVFRARHVRLNRLVAIKMPLAGAYAGPHELERFQREAEAVAALRHPNIIQIHDIADVDGRPYLTMEYVDGGTLGQQLTGAPRVPREAAALIATLAAAVHAAHACGIVHRDLKPANIFLTADGTPKIGDFGLARRLYGEAGITRTGTAIGTASYMAPEQAGESTGPVGPHADVYALGSILYELLTGRPPFCAARADVTLYQVLTRDPEPPSRLNGKVPRDLETICLMCLRKLPQQRYATASELADDLGRFLGGEAILARPEGRLSRVARRVRRRPVLSAALALATLSTVGLIGGGLWFLSDREAKASAARAGQEAVEHAADQDLDEMESELRKSEWDKARAALERARGRLGDRQTAQIHARLDQGVRELRIIPQLVSARVDFWVTVGGFVNFTQCDLNYEKAFRAAELGNVHDDPNIVADRIRASNIQAALLAALDHWSTIASDTRKDWVLTVARRADRDATGWQVRARDPAARTNLAALTELVETAPVAEQSVSLLLALDFYLPTTSQHKVPFLKRVQQAHPSDFWANLALGSALLEQKNPVEAIRYYQAATAIRPKVAISHNNLGLALMNLPRTSHDPAIDASVHFRRAAELDPSCAKVHFNLGHALAAFGRYAEAIPELQWAIRLEPGAPLFHVQLGVCLNALGRFDDAEAAFREATVLGPRHRNAQDELRSFLIRRGRSEDARKAWQAALAADPPEHNAWDGYAEYCLFLGREDEYRRACQDVMNRFGNNTDPRVAERISRACLLLPGSAQEAVRAAAMIDRAIAVSKEKPPASFLPYFMVTKALAEYRLDRPEQAISILKGEPPTFLRPLPELILAMAQYRIGQKDIARETLATAVLSFNWRPSDAKVREAWMYHVLRREAERMILPNLPAFLSGTYKPQDNDERLALLGVCQFESRTRALAQLYTDAFAADPSLADAAGHRVNAVRAAALAGCGRGTDAAALGEAERARWRSQARAWLRADLAAWRKEFASASGAARDGMKMRLANWQTEPDLAGIRESAELAKLPAGEREDCIALWNDVGDDLRRAAGGK